MHRCYKYPPISLSKHEVMSTAHARDYGTKHKLSIIGCEIHSSHSGMVANHILYIGKPHPTSEINGVLVNREMQRNAKRNGSHTHKLNTSAQAHHSAWRIFSCAEWLTPSLDSVRDVGLMFYVYFLLLRISILLLYTVVEFLPFSCMLTSSVAKLVFSIGLSSLYALNV